MKRRFDGSYLSLPIAQIIAIIVAILPALVVPLITAAIGAIMLRGSIALRNAGVGRDSDHEVPSVDFTGAYTITFVSYLTTAVVSLVLSLLLPLLLQTEMPMFNLQWSGMAARPNLSFAQWVAIAPAWLVMAAMICWLLPTSLRRALVLAAIQYAMTFALIAAIVIAARMTGSVE